MLHIIVEILQQFPGIGRDRRGYIRQPVGHQTQAPAEIPHKGWVRAGRELGPDAVILVNLSGRGDKDVATAAKYFGIDATTADGAPGQGEL